MTDDFIYYMEDLDLRQILVMQKKSTTHEIEKLNELYTLIYDKFKIEFNCQLAKDNRLIKKINIDIIFEKITNYLRYDISKKYGINKQIPQVWRTRITDNIKKEIKDGDYFECKSRGSWKNGYFLIIYPSEFIDWEEFEDKECKIDVNDELSDTSRLIQNWSYLPFYGFKPVVKTTITHRKWDNDIGSDTDPSILTDSDYYSD